MKLFQNVIVLSSIFIQNKSGTLTLKVGENAVSVSVYHGDVVINQDKSALIDLIDKIDLADVTFEPHTIAQTYSVFPLINPLWEFSKKNVTMANLFCEEHLSHRYLGKSSKNLLYKLGQISTDDFLVYLFFSKSDKRALKDLIAFYPYKDEEKLKILVYRLFVVGQLMLTTQENESVQVVADANSGIETKNALLQKLLNRVSNLSY